MMLHRAALVAGAACVASGDIDVCPGESARYGDHKCNHDTTHRVCAKLLDDAGQPLSWGDGDFWEITGQKDFQWDAEIRANNGDSWCICMWATARLISSAGCDNVHLDCGATDLTYVMQQYEDGGVDLAPAKDCLEQKCPAAGAQRLNDADLPVLARPVAGLPAAPIAGAMLSMAGFLAWRLARAGPSDDSGSDLAGTEAGVLE